MRFSYFGRSDRIRTCGLLVPNQAHYQTVPHPVVFSFCVYKSFLCQQKQSVRPEGLTRRRIVVVRHSQARFFNSLLWAFTSENSYQLFSVRSLPNVHIPLYLVFVFINLFLCQRKQSVRPEGLTRRRIVVVRHSQARFFNSLLWAFTSENSYQLFSVRSLPNVHTPLYLVFVFINLFLCQQKQSVRPEGYKILGNDFSFF